MKELSIFVDESGDFGEYDYHAPYYIISMVLHNQNADITKELDSLEKELNIIGWPHHCVHAGPVIRSEEEYRGYDLISRQRILKKMMSFIRHVDINFKSIYIEKKHIQDSIEATGKLSKQLALFIRENYAYFCDFDQIKIYYDNGQIEVTRILSSVFNALLDNVEFRKVIPADYRLFQVADLICTLKLTELKMHQIIYMSFSYWGHLHFNFYPGIIFNCSLGIFYQNIYWLFELLRNKIISQFI